MTKASERGEAEARGEVAGLLDVIEAATATGLCRVDIHFFRTRTWKQAIAETTLGLLGGGIGHADPGVEPPLEPLGIRLELRGDDDEITAHERHPLPDGSSMTAAKLLLGAAVTAATTSGATLAIHGERERWVELTPDDDGRLRSGLVSAGEARQRLGELGYEITDGPDGPAIRHTHRTPASLLGVLFLPLALPFYLVLRVFGALTWGEVIRGVTSPFLGTRYRLKLRADANGLAAVVEPDLASLPVSVRVAGRLQALFTLPGAYHLRRRDRGPTLYAVVDGALHAIPHDAVPLGARKRAIRAGAVLDQEHAAPLLEAVVLPD